jgi:hypothetical protein
MSRNNANSDKTGGFPLEPVTVPVELDDETITIDAAHHIVNDDAKLLHLYIDGRDGGIDVTVPLTDGAAEPWARSDLGREVLGLPTSCDNPDCDELVEHDLKNTCSTQCAAVVQNAQELGRGATVDELLEAGVPRDKIDASIVDDVTGGE